VAEERTRVPVEEERVGLVADKFIVKARELPESVKTKEPSVPLVILSEFWRVKALPAPERVKPVVPERETSLSKLKVRVPEPLLTEAMLVPPAKVRVVPKETVELLPESPAAVKEELVRAELGIEVSPAPEP